MSDPTCHCKENYLGDAGHPADCPVRMLFESLRAEVRAVHEQADKLLARAESAERALEAAAGALHLNQWGQDGYCPDCGSIEDSETHDEGCWIDETLALLRAALDSVEGERDG